jgi:hypothetical protein
MKKKMDLLAAALVELTGSMGWSRQRQGQSLQMATNAPGTSLP